MKFMQGFSKAYVCGLGVGILLASSGLAHAVQSKAAKISAQTLVAIKKAVEVVQQGNFSAEEKQLLGFVSGLCAGVSELDAVAYVVTGKGFDYTSTYGALAYLAKKVAALQETAPCAVKESYSTVAAVLDTLLAEFVLAADGCAPGDARSVTIDLSSVLEKLNEIQAMLSDILDIIEGGSSGMSGSCCEPLTSLLEVVIANEETIIADVAAVQTTANTINTTTAATQTTVNTINGTVNTINTTTAATNTTVNNIQSSVEDVLAAIDAQSAANESCCEHLTSMLETVIANEEAIIADVAAVQTTVDTINGKTTAISSTVNTINGTVNTINTTTTATNGTVNTINGTTAATQATVNTINTTTTTTNTTVNNIQSSVEDVLAAIDAQAAANESCCEHLTSMLETVIANEEAIITDIAVVQTTVNTINTTTATTNTTVNTINTTVDATDSKIDVLQSTINEITAGDCTPIYNNGTNTIIINRPGSYCLAENVGLSSGDSVVINIVSDNVVLNLNGFEVFSLVASSTGIEVDGVSSVVIKNGTIRSDSINGFNGIAASNVFDVNIHDVVVKNWQSAGITFSQATNVTIDNLTSHDNGNQGILVSSSSETIVISNSIFENNAGSGCDISSTTGLAIRNSVVQGNGTSIGEGITIKSSSDCSLENCMVCENLSGTGFTFDTVTNGTIVECSAFHNGNLSDKGGFRIVNSTNLEFTSCVATQNRYNGFHIQSGNIKIVMQKCMASDNDLNGFDLGFAGSGGSNNNIILDGCQSVKNDFTGFGVGSGSTVVLIQSCRALGNSINGFSTSSVTNNRYYANAAYLNGSGNYNGNIYNGAAVVTAPVTATASTYWAANVDGAI